MIIYGSRAAHIKSAHLDHETCSSCGQKGSLTLSVFRRHVHIFWIPLFPIGKTGASQCQHCKNVLQPKEMPDSLRQEYNSLKSEARGPLWQFAGLGIILILIIMLSISSSNDKKQALHFVSSPMIGDIYEYKLESGEGYSTFKIVNIAGDSVHVNHNQYETNKVTGLYDIEKEENYLSVSYGFHKEELARLFQEGKIIDILRP